MRRRRHHLRLGGYLLGSPSGGRLQLVKMKDVVRALAAPCGAGRAHELGRVRYLEIVTASARVTSFQSLIVVSALKHAVGRRGSGRRALQVLPGPRAAAKHSSTRSGQRVRTD